MSATLIFCFIAGVGAIFMGIFASAIRLVPESERLAVYRLGRYIGEKGPGLVFVIPVIDTSERGPPGSGDPRLDKS